MGCLIIILNQQTFSQRLDGIGIVGEISGCCFPDKTHLNVFQAFFWPRKYGFTLKFSRHFMNLPESQKKSASCLRPAKWSSECLWLLLIFEMIFSIIVILNVNHSGNLSLYDGYHVIFKRSSLQQDLNDIYCHHYYRHNGPLDIQNHHDHHYHKSWRWSSYLHLCSWFSTSWYTFQANHAILLDMVMMMVMMMMVMTMIMIKMMMIKV